MTIQNSILQPEVLQLKGSLFTVTALHLYTTNIDTIRKELSPLIRRAPKLFQHTPIVIDVQGLKPEESSIDFVALTELLRTLGLIPVGIRGGSTELRAAALSVGLAIFTATRPHPDTVESLAQAKPKTADTAKKTPKAATNTKIVTKPVRSGQQIYAQEGDLIVLNSVGQGAELLADGNIHIYGTLRGRALAGVNGNTKARIFCHCLEAELVAIAGCYMMNDASNQLVQRLPHQIYLANEKLNIVPL